MAGQHRRYAAENRSVFHVTLRTTHIGGFRHGPERRTDTKQGESDPGVRATAVDRASAGVALALLPIEFAALPVGRAA